MSYGIKRIVAGLGLICIFLAIAMFMGQVGISGLMNIGFVKAYSEWASLEDSQSHGRSLSDKEVGVIAATVSQRTRLDGHHMATEQMKSDSRLCSMLLTIFGVSLLVFSSRSNSIGAEPTRVRRRLRVRSALIMASLAVLFLISSLFVLSKQERAATAIHRGFDRAYQEWVRLLDERPLHGESIDERIDGTDVVWCSGQAAGPLWVVEVAASQYRVKSMCFSVPGVALLVVCLWGHFIPARSL